MNFEVKLKSTIPLLTIIVFIVIISLIIKLGVIEVGVRPQLISLFAVYMIVFLIRRFSDLIVRLEFHSKLYSMNNIVNKFLYIVLGISLVLYSQLEDVYSLVIANIFSVSVLLYLEFMGNVIFGILRKIIIPIYVLTLKSY